MEEGGAEGSENFSMQPRGLFLWYFDKECACFLSFYKSLPGAKLKAVFGLILLAEKKSQNRLAMTLSCGYQWSLL